MHCRCSGGAWEEALLIRRIGARMKLLYVILVSPWLNQVLLLLLLLEAERKSGENGALITVRFPNSIF